MRRVRCALVRLVGLFRGYRRDRELDAEFDAHLRAHIDTLSARAAEWLTIAGVVVNTPFAGLGENIRFAQLYMPMFSAREVNLPARVDAMSYILRTAVPSTSLAAPSRGAVAAIDSRLAVAQVQTLQDSLDRASEQMAFTMALIIIAAGVALVLGMIGIYGVTSYIVTQRTGEIGVRLALGAEPGSVAAMIVRQGGLIALVGIAVGLAAAFTGSRLIASLLYGVSSRDPGVFAAATLALMSVALVAWLPARRAASVDPLVALRAE